MITNGILLIDKPEGITSARTVSRIKKALRIKKAGHTGTLDPSATGILIVCLNRSTKIAQYLSSLDKVYMGTMVLGITTDTQDFTGKIQEIKTINPKKLNTSEIKSVFFSFQGDIWQIPPMFSALKHKGRPLYSLARKGIKVNLAPRKVRISQLKILKIQYDRYPSITFQVRCSKGTYIRTLCHDIGKSLGFGAYLSSLRRIQIGNYSINESIPLKQFLRMSTSGQHHQLIIPLHRALSHMNKIVLLNNRELLDRVKNGGHISEKEIKEKEIVPGINAGLTEIFVVYSSEGHLTAIAKNLGKFSNRMNRYKVDKILP